MISLLIQFIENEIYFLKFIVIEVDDKNQIISCVNNNIKEIREQEGLSVLDEYSKEIDALNISDETYNSIKNKVSSGLAWVKKNLFGHKHSATHNPKY